MVVRPDGSDPASASVRAKEATASPEAILGNHASFWPGVPPSISTCPAIPLLVPNIDRSAGVVYPSSITTRLSSSIDNPNPPSASDGDED